MRYLHLPLFFAVPGLLAACTLIVDHKLERKPSEMETTDGGDGTDAMSDTDASPNADGSAHDASSMPGDATSPPGDGGTSESDGAIGSIGDDGSMPPGDAGSSGQPTGDGRLKMCAGLGHACGLSTTGHLTCWGNDGEDQLKLPTNVTYIDIACGDYHTCALDSAGALHCVGRNQDGQRITAPGPYVQVTAGATQTCVRDTAGKAHCLVQDGTTITESPVPDKVFSSIGAGNGFACGLSAADATLLCWGSGASALNNTTQGKKFIAFDAAPSGICGITDALGVFCTAGIATPPALDDVVQVSAGDYNSCALLRDGSVSCWGAGVADSKDEAPYVYVVSGGTAYCLLPKSAPPRCRPEHFNTFAPAPGDFR